MGRQLLLTAVFTMAAAQVQAGNCAQRDQVVNRLQAEYSEQLTAGGLQGKQTDQSLVEVWSSPQTGTFTVMLTNAEGLSCIVATGTDWFSQQPLNLQPDTAS
jgi:hypothetical protein